MSDLERDIGPFHVEYDEDTPHILYVDVGNLNVLLIMTSEGVIVDVLPGDSNGFENDELVLGTLGVMFQDADRDCA